MTKTSRTKLAVAVGELLRIKATIAAFEKDAEVHKKTVTDLCLENQDAFTDGVLTLEDVGQIRVVQNKPKLVGLDDTEITPLRMTQLVAKMEDQFRKETINIAMLRDYAKAGDKSVLKVLAKLGVKVVQDTRFDVKKL